MTRNEGDGSGRTQGNKATRIRAQPVAEGASWTRGRSNCYVVRTSVRAGSNIPGGGALFLYSVRTSEAPGLPVRKLRLSNRETARALVPELGDNGDCVLHEG